MKEFLEISPVIPVVEIEDPASAQELGQALMRGGIGIIEVTLRTRCALEAISELASLPGLTVGAGTLLGSEDVLAAKEAGATFGVSPGSTDKLIDAVRDVDFPFLPGAATPSEIAKLLSAGFGIQKFFPAEAAGGLKMLNALHGPFKDVSFCPTGGVSADNASEYLNLSNVVCVGGSWIATKNLIARHSWDSIEENARLASSLGHPQAQ